MQGEPSHDIRVWGEAIERALNRAGDRALGTQVFFERRVDLTVEATSGGVSRTYNRVCGVSAFSPRLGVLAHLADPLPEDAERVVAAALESRHVPARATAAGGVDSTPRATEPDPEHPAAVTTGLATALARESSGIQALARWIDFSQEVVIGLAGAPVVADVRRGARVRLEGRFVGRGSTFGPAVAEATLGRSQDSPPADLAARVASRLRARLDCRPAPAGEQPLIFAAGVGGILIHEIVGHALEGDVAASGSWLHGSRDPVAKSNVTVVDDPRRGRAAWLTDDEGVPSRPIPLIREGRVRGRLHDRATAHAAGVVPTGHGRRSSYKERVLPRMGCTFLAPGGSKPEEILSSVERGIYVHRLEAAHVDPRAGRAVFRIVDAELIERGTRGVSLRPHLIVVDSRQALLNIERVADDLQFDTCVGSCQRHGQPLAVSVGAPTIRLGVAMVVA